MIDKIEDDIKGIHTLDWYSVRGRTFIILDIRETRIAIVYFISDHGNSLP